MTGRAAYRPAGDTPLARLKASVEGYSGWFVGLAAVGLAALILIIVILNRRTNAVAAEPRAKGDASEVALTRVAPGKRSSEPAQPSDAPDPNSRGAEGSAPAGQDNLLDEAARGDDQAMQQVKRGLVEGLSTEEVFALASGNAAKSQRRLEYVRKRLHDERGAKQDTALLRQLLGFTEHSATAKDALKLMAGLPGGAAADVLFEVWKRPRTPADVKELAEALLYSREVQRGASTALKVAFALHQVQDCESTKAMLPRVSMDGDKRCLPVLKKLSLGYGCGPGRQDDCHPCLRENRSAELVDALGKVRERSMPEIAIETK